LQHCKSWLAKWGLLHTKMALGTRNQNPTLQSLAHGAET
jgi:hypothetical protein